MVTDGDDDFAALFEASSTAARVTQGQTVEGTVVGIGPEVALVDIGAKSEAVIDVAELTDHEGTIEVAVGERLQAVVASTAGGIRLARRLGRGAASRRQLEDAYRAGLPVEGTVEREVKAGYEVRVAGQRAFCPVSQIDNVRTTDTAVHVGRTYEFRIVDIKEDGADLVVSRRALLDERQRAEAEEVRRAITEGAVVSGRVASVRDYGAFVDLGAGVQGLLHVSEMGWSRVPHAAEAVQPGDEITVKVLRVDHDTQRIALGLKQLTDDPWTRAASSYDVGQVRSARVTRLAQFGAFVELEPGIEALAHASTFGAGGQPQAWRRLVPVGTTAEFEILSVDAPSRRIGVALADRRGEGSEAARRDVRSDDRGASPTRDRDEADERPAASGPVEGFGSLADKLRGALDSRRK